MNKSMELGQQPDDVAARFARYESHYQSFNRADGLEVTSLTHEEYAAVLQDPASSILVIDAGEAQEMHVPLTTPIGNLAWYNQQYFQDAAEAAGLERDIPIVYYDHLAGLLRDYPAAYRRVVRPALYELVDRGGLLVTDHLDTHSEQTRQEFSTLLSSLGMRAKDVLPDFDPEARHFNFAGPAVLANPAMVREEPLSLGEAAAARPKLAEGVAVEQALTAEESETVWQYYKTRFDELTDVDPVRASSPREELFALFQDERVLKAVQRIGREIVCLTMYGDVRHFTWANQRYYASNFPNEYAQGNVLFFPGAVAKPEVKGYALPVMETVGRLLCAAGVERSIISFVCNKVSRRPISKLSTMALNRSGMVSDLTQPVSERIFQAFVLSNGEQQ